MIEPVEFLVEHNVAFLFGAVFIDQIGVPLPSLPWLLAAGALSTSGDLNLWPALGSATLGAIAADLIWFFLGRAYGNSVLALVYKIFPDPDLWARRTQNLFDRYGMWGVAAAKFFPILKTLVPALAGSSRASVPRFLLFDGLGALLHGGAFILLGILFSEQLDQILGLFERHGARALILVAGIAVVYIAWQIIQRRRKALSKSANLGL